MKAAAAVVGLSFLLASLPAEAQRGRMSGGTSIRGGVAHHFQGGGGRVSAGPGVQGKFATGRPSFPTHSFGSGSGLQHRSFRTGFGFGFVPTFPVFGLGFDAHHFQVLHGHRFVTPVVSPFFFPSAAVSSTVVVVPQLVPQVIQVPVVVAEPERRVEYYPSTAERLVGTPRAEERVQVVPPALPGEPPPAPRLTLLVFRDHSIYAVVDYWLEGGQLHYLTSYGARNTVPFERIDLDMTVRLNWERGIAFALRPEPSAR